MNVRLVGILRTNQGGAAEYFRRELRRSMVGKPPRRAAVHGVKLPVADRVPREELKGHIERGIEEKERRRREIEEIVDSNLKNWQVLYVEKIIGSH